MRLINIDTLELHEFFEKNIPKYVILSHRWGDGETSYKDYVKKRRTGSPGHMKILDACRFVRVWRQRAQEDIVWLWIDTICIDKRSSAELSEAINSMYSWYMNAEVCFAYLSDVPAWDGLWVGLWESRLHHFQSSA